MKIAITSGKGGTGKTTISTNLTKFLSKTSEVYLYDLDVEEPNSGLFLEAEIINTKSAYRKVPEWDEASCTLCNECTNNCNFNAIMMIADSVIVFPELCHSCYACSDLCPSSSLPMLDKEIGMIREYSSANIKFVEGKLKIGEEQAVPMISQTKEYFHITSGKHALYDSPPGTSCPVIEAVKDSDLILLVTEPTIFGFHDFKIAAETFKKLKKEFVVIINKYGIGDNQLEEYCRENNIEIIAKIKYSKKVAELYSNGKTMIESLNDFEEQIAKIATYINNR